MNDERVRTILLLIEAGQVRWSIRSGRVGPEFHTGSRHQSTYAPVSSMGALSERLYHRHDFDRAEEGLVSLTDAGERLLAELDGRSPKPSVWSRGSR